MNHCYIIGGGIAGFASGIAAARLGYKVSLLEKEDLPFSYASSRNAAIFRSYEGHPGLSILVKNSFQKIKEWEAESGMTMLDQVGLFIRPLEVDYSESSTKPELQSKDYTLITPGQQSEGRFLQNNGVIQLDAYLDYFSSLFKQSGGEIYNGAVQELTIQDNRIHKIQLNQRDSLDVQQQDLVLFAAGSWLARSALTKKLPFLPGLIPHKRHLFVLESEEEWRSLPVVWDELQEFYFRPYDGNILVTHGDENPVMADDYEVEQTAESEFRAAAQDAFPFLAAASILESRACLRTFTMDRLPVCGYDPLIRNLFWQGGWGGRGISIAPAMIDYTYSIMNDVEVSNNPEKNQFSPYRFL